MATFQGLLFLVFGVGLLLVDYQSLSRGWLPCGSKWFKGRVQFRRDGQPFFYWLMFVVYGLAGIALTIFAVRVLTGHAAPLPVR
jgi:hypothetical protein